MAVTTLDARPALVVVDLQRGIVGPDPAQPVRDVVDRSARLAAAFRAKGLPVVLVNVAGSAPGRTDAPPRPRAERPADWSDLVPELDRQAGDKTVTKKSWGAFTRTDLDAYLQQQAVSQVVVTGIATSIGVESTARAAYELGYHVVLATDAMADLTPEAHEAALAGIFRRIGESGTTQEILDLLATHA
ncbi:nicotinamidase-related amidase [Sediminihabitans luteus]|uniref:Nicotinamidase-related amidase n=1 Tax=Sediminihabitans luteus TaxID=1138585 RepID=A0A2M9CEV1_9CELL|nr:isochorismatase family protein [Sediminihabitans luteus]PJJ70423.1 nicotinamidase-related amidase [Sediminihabitans luteus]GII97895.1 hydrolase [Sediminihabitans luteus]